MIAYLDTSVVLRAVFGEPEAFRGWAGLEYAVSSQLLQNEALRTLDRRRVASTLPEAALSRVHATTHDLLSRVSLVPLTPAVLARAAEPFPTTLGTLDALHLATALLWRDATGDTPVFLTHDAQLGRGARACGLPTPLCPAD